MKRTITAVIAVATLLLITLLMSPLRVGAQPPAPEELPAEMPSALRGRAIYEARCTRCHGPQGAGDGAMAAQLPAPPPSFLDVEHMRQVTPAAYFDLITNGNLDALMPPWREALSAQERWDVLFYVWSLGTTREQIDAGKAIYSQTCAECHGEAGNKIDTVDLSDQATLATLSQADLFASVRDGHADTDFKDSLTDDERWAVVDYVRTFTYEPAFAAEEATGDGVIEGQVVDGTAGAQADLGGIEVTLFPFVGQSTLTPITTTTAPDGSFRIEGLATGTDRNYGLQATYQGVDYFHPELISLSDSPSATVTLHVYETTTDESAISVDRNHVIIDFANNQLQVAELYIFRNSGDRTYIGDGATLRFALPAGAQNVRFDDPRMNQSTGLEDNQVVDTLPVPPGNRQVLLSYSVPYDGRSISFEKQILYQTQNLNVLISDVGVEVDAGSLTTEAPVSTQNNARFLNYTRQNVPAGEKLSLKLSNLPRGSTAAAAGVPADQSGKLRWFGLGFLVIALTLALGYPVLRPRLLSEEALMEDTAEVVLRRQRQMLLEELAELDDAYEAGEVAESNYIDARAEIKADLIDIMQQLRDIEESGQGSQ
ncbi:MAG: hypothetical protein D6791_08535 [Chloroflexi bacterium]|nr:MAG: hypothetical protein D6791_08535 [Chloroflexota bacterium]